LPIVTQSLRPQPVKAPSRVDDQQRHVVGRVAGMPDHLVTESVGQGGGVGRGAHSGVVGEGEEYASLVPCLARFVGVEQERVAGLERDGDREAGHAGEVTQAEWQAAWPASRNTPLAAGWSR
jgi:hypothetical protein